MNKIVKLFLVLLLLSSMVYAREVPNTTQGVANAVPGDHIIRANGQRVVLTQNDIDHARRQLGLRPSQNIQTTQNTQNRPSPAPANNPRTNFNLFNTIIFILISFFVIRKLLLIYVPIPFLKNIFKYKSEAKKNCVTEEVFSLSMSNNKDLKEEAIMISFLIHGGSRIKKYYIWSFEVYNNQNEQNYAWAMRFVQDIHDWGTVNRITFYFSNGWIRLDTSDTKFITDEKRSKKGFPMFYSTHYACLEQARTMWKVFGREPYGNLPFNFFIADYDRITKKFSFYKPSREENKEKPPPSEKPPPDFLAPHRNLLGLKMNFTKKELKSAYREAVKKYHPDRFVNSSLKEKEKAEIKTRQINEAYTELEKPLQKR